MSSTDQSIEVELPVRTVYNQWTQFESFPSFMEGVKSVRQMGDRSLRWEVEIAGKTVSFDAEITEQTPDTRIAWRSRSGRNHAGMVSFQSLSPSRTRVTLSMEYDPEGVAENAADFLGVVKARIRGDLERFKKFVQERGGETGAWRGEIHSHA